MKMKATTSINILISLTVALGGFFNSFSECFCYSGVPWELSNLRPTMTLGIYALFSFLAILFVHGFVVETKGKSLEELEQMLIKN
ncbi:hypothetical protein BFP77_05690 [Maribacter sp. 4U21]|uniref:MFS transporter n=1 Tax=Maribacter sp. 4U21 TaxID=1889779 RepID=UPI000C148DB5|nr:MFS transporter [Maribacter sp. 4U21]PIB29641.1 hypothetical protein BFP77_05690 [Maribacter sp. 4U21]